MPELSQSHHIEYSFKREINELFTSVSLKNIAIALVAIFEPIFFYQFFGNSVIHVLLFFSIISILFGIFVSFGAKVVSKIGVKHSILLSMPFIILYYFGLNWLETFNWIIYLLPVLNVTYKIFFWPAYHLDFAKFSEGKTRGRQLGILKIINLSAGALSPLLGGFIIMYFGFNVLFIFAIVLLISSVIPLFLSKEVYDKFDFNYKALKKVITKHHFGSHLSFIGWGIDSGVDTIIWPLMLFLVLGNFSTIGGIAAVATLVIILFVFYIGKLSDKYGAKKIMKIGIIPTALGWLGRGFVVNVFSAFTLNSFYKFSFQVLSLGFNKEVYKRMNLDTTRLNYIVYREIMLHSGRVFVLIAAAVLFILTGSFLPAVIIAAIGILIMNLYY